MFHELSLSRFLNSDSQESLFLNKQWKFIEGQQVHVRSVTRKRFPVVKWTLLCFHLIAASCFLPHKVN